MVTTENLQSLESFQDAAQDLGMGGYATLMAVLHDRIETECPSSVLWAVAYGAFLDPERRPGSRASTKRMDILVVTKEESAFDAYLSLGEKVFGPALLEFSKLPSYVVWTRSDLKAAVKADHDVLRKLRRHGVTIYGAPPLSLAVA